MFMFIWRVPMWDFSAFSLLDAVAANSPPGWRHTNLPAGMPFPGIDTRWRWLPGKVGKSRNRRRPPVGFQKHKVRGRSQRWPGLKFTHRSAGSCRLAAKQRRNRKMEGGIGRGAGFVGFLKGRWMLLPHPLLFTCHVWSPCVPVAPLISTGEFAQGKFYRMRAKDLSQCSSQPNLGKFEFREQKINFKILWIFYGF